MNLPETQVYIKKLILVAVVLTMIYYAGKFVVDTGVAVYRFIFPEPVPTVEAKYGPLPKLEMQSAQITGNPKYNLDTQSGGFPDFPDRVFVYKFREPTPNLLSEQRMKKLALDLGFDQPPKNVTTSDFRWIDGNNNRLMEANVVTENYFVNTDLNKLSSVLSTVPTIRESDAINMASNFIKAENLVSAIDQENMTYTTIPSVVTLGQLKDSNLVPSNAKIVKVNAYRKLLESSVPKGVVTSSKDTPKLTEFNILGPNPGDPNIAIYVTNEKNLFKFPLIEFNYWDIDYQEKSDYMLSPINAVWDVITQGNGVIAYIKLKNEDYYDPFQTYEVDKIDIREVYIAYYEPKEYSKYLQPIYVFEGKFSTTRKENSLPKEGDIVIYYPAVRGDFVN